MCSSVQIRHLIDYALGCPELLTKFVDSLKDKWGIGRSGQMCYVASISDLLNFRKFNRPAASVLQNFAVTEGYVKRAQKYQRRTCDLTGRVS